MVKLLMAVAMFTVFLSAQGMASESVSDSIIVKFKLTDSIKKFLRENEFDVTGVNYKTMEIEALLTEEELARIRSQKTNIIYSFPKNLLLAPDERYFNPDEIEEFIMRIHEEYPEITHIKVIGKTLEGRNIHAVKISDHAKLDEKEPTILVNAMHHAREVMTPEITTDMIDYLTSNYGRDPKVTDWVTQNEIWVIPMLNLDGNNKMWNKDWMWRKNTRNGHGVDINRNYPTGWNSCNGSSGWTTAQDYRGTHPASEPETQAMMNFVSTIKPVFNISYHSYSELVLYPFGCRPKRTPSEEAVESIGKEMAKKLDYMPGTAWELLYNADGGDIDWMYTEHQVIPYVIEVNSTNDGGFHPNYSKHRDVTVERNRAGWMHLLDRLSGPGLFGRVPKGQFGTIQISKFLGEVIQTYKINPDGTFYIILNPGKYDVSFNGKEKRLFRGIEVTKKVTLKLN